MLIRLFNRIYQFVLSNKILKLGFYLILILFPICYYLLLINNSLVFGESINLMIPIYIIVFIEIILRLKIISTKISENIKYITKIYFIIELFLVIFKPANIFDQYLINNLFLSYKTSAPSYYHIRKSFEKYHLKSKEFNFERQVNSIGIPDKEISKQKPFGVTRILCLGDSFTEGDGADKDSSYVKFLERSLQKKHSNIEVINAGRCGSDPFFDYKLLHDIMIDYQPDIVIQSFTSNDLFFDMVTKGGNKRFQLDKTIDYYKKHWWTPIYAVSFTSRILIQAFGGYDKFFIKQKDYPLLIEKMKIESTKLFKEYYSLTQENYTDLIVFTIPFKDFYKSTENNDFHKEMSSNFSKFGLKFYNIQPCYEDEIKLRHTKPQDYYWKIDGHHNAKGYEMMAKCLEEIVTPIIEKRLENQNTLVN